MHLPLVVSLSRTRKVPLLFSKLSSSLSESRRVILPKYHLLEVQREKNMQDKIGEEEEEEEGGGAYR